MPLQFKRFVAASTGTYFTREKRAALLGSAVSALEIAGSSPIFALRGRRARTESMEKAMANITRYDPFGDLFDDIFSGFVVGPVGFEAANPVRRMKVDVAEQNGEYTGLAELPGVKKEDIKVSIDGDQVSITAESRAERDEQDGERLLHS